MHGRVAPCGSYLATLRLAAEAALLALHVSQAHSGSALHLGSLAPPTRPRSLVHTSLLDQTASAEAGHPVVGQQQVAAVVDHSSR